MTKGRNICSYFIVIVDIISNLLPCCFVILPFRKSILEKLNMDDYTHMDFKWIHILFITS